MSAKKIGIAGYMGAGKSTCVRLLANESTVVINADEHAKELMQRDESIRQSLFCHFGSAIQDDGRINSKALGKIVFETPSELDALNAIVHPPLIIYLKKYLQEKSLEPGVTKVLLDAALIPLWKIENWFDCLIWVDATREVRLRRLYERLRGAMSETEIVQRMNEQEKLFKKSENIKWIEIPNNGNIAELENICHNLQV